MNFMNGSECVEIINKFINDKKMSSIPILFSTAFQDAEHISHIQRLKPKKILNKPVKKHLLLDAFTECKIFENLK
jgi:response regulator RpfG family c-di-GMP phosphodiesterase